MYSSSSYYSSYDQESQRADEKAVSGSAFSADISQLATLHNQAHGRPSSSEADSQLTSHTTSLRTTAQSLSRRIRVSPRVR